MTLKRNITFLLLIVLFAGCLERPSSRKSDQNSDLFTKKELKYAKGFTIQSSGKVKIVTVFDPWNPKDTLATYCISGDTIINDSGCDFLISIPLNSIASLSSTSTAMLSLIGEGRKITASSDARLIYDPVLYSRYLNGSIADLGNTHLINAEMIIEHSPDLVMKYIYGSKELVDEKIIEAGLPVAFNLEFMEDHPLGRAEWIKFLAVFFDKDDLADSIFNSIEMEYMRLVNLCAYQNTKPTVLDGSGYNGIWHAAGGKSYSAKMYADAGASYYWQTDSSKGSIPLSFEVIIDKQAESDYWFGPSTGKRNELLSIDNRYTQLKSFREGNVFFFGKRVNPNGGMDYFESGVVRPDIVLKDLIRVFHPELLDSDYDPVYLQKME